MDSMEYETGLRCAGEYSDTMNANNLFFPNLFVFSQILKYCIIKMYKWVNREGAASRILVLGIGHQRN